MSNPMGDRNLLAGILAWQRKFIGRDVLVAAMNAWTLAKETGLAQILREQKALTENQHALLEEAVHDHLARHGNDVQKTLAALRAVDPVKQELAHIADPELQASLAHVSSANAPAAEEAVLVAEVAAAAPKKTTTPQMPVKAAAKKSVAAKPQAKTPARGSPALIWLTGCALGGGFAVLLGTLVLGLAVFLLRDHPRFAQAKPDDPVNHVNGVGNGGNKPLPIEDPKDPDPLKIEPKPFEPKPAPPVVADGFVPLFNGKDLTGWKPHKTRGGDWRVENGILVGSPRNNGAYFLQTEQPQPRDFHLRVEARMGAPGNGSIYFRYQPDGPIVGYEAMIRAANNLPGQVDVGGLALTNPGKGRAFPGGTRTQVPVGQWFTLEVIAKGDRLIAKADGQTTVDMIDPSIMTAGHVALGQITQSPIEFRKIEIKELKGGADPPLLAADGFVPLFNSKDLTGWEPHDKYPGGWRVEEGILIGSAPQVGYLASKRYDFKDFHLRVETRFNDQGAGGDGSVLFRATADLLGFSTLINHPIIKATGNTYVGTKTMGRDTGISSVPTPPGAWHTLEVIAIGDRIQIIVNGKNVGAFVDKNKDFTSGRIMLRHNPKTVLEFRKIEIKDLKVAAAPPIAVAKDFVPLFNGKDLTGWKKHPTQGRNWAVENGFLVGSGDDKLGLLFTDRVQPKNFHLRVEVRVSDKGHGAVMIRCPEDSMFGYDTQMTRVQGAFNVGNLRYQTPGESGFLPGRAGRVMPPDQWVTLEIIAYEKRLIVTVNGAVTTDVEDAKTLNAGHIRLLHGRASKIEFRKIEIKELLALAMAPPPPPPEFVLPPPPRPLADFVPAFNGKDLTGWRVEGVEGKGGWKANEAGELVGQGPDTALISKRTDYRDLVARIELSASADVEAFFGFRETQGQSAKVVGLTSRLTGDGAIVRAGNSGSNGTKVELGKPRIEVKPGEVFLLEFYLNKNNLHIVADGKTTGIIIYAPASNVPGAIGLHIIKGSVRIKKFEISAEGPPKDAPPFAVAKDFVPLFNGNDLTGWKRPLGFADAWRVEKGMLIGAAPPQILIRLHTEAKFKDFHLRAEVRSGDKNVALVGFRSSDGIIRGYNTGVVSMGPGGGRAGVLNCNTPTKNFGVSRPGADLRQQRDTHTSNSRGSPAAWT